MRISLHGVVFPLLLLGSLAGCGKGPQDSPEAAYYAMWNAMQSEDWATACSYWSSDSVDIMAATMVMSANGQRMMSAFSSDSKAALEEVDAVFAKHGVDQIQVTLSLDKEAMREMVTPIKDRAQFVADMIAANPATYRPAVYPQKPRIEDVRITEDIATATLVGADGEETPIDFKKEAAGWKVVIMEPLLDSMPPFLR